MSPISNQNFEGQVLSGLQWQEHILDDCDFIDTIIEGSNLSLAKFKNCRLVNVQFRNCKVIGVKFSENNARIPPSLSFEDCVLNGSSFAGVSFYKSKVYQCEARDTDFFRADMRECDCRYTDFHHAILSEANLQKADFRFAQNYSLNVLENPTRLKKAKFSRDSLEGLLNDLNIIVE
jgi:fluoroquinolone resistance protein